MLDTHEILVKYQGEITQSIEKAITDQQLNEPVKREKMAEMIRNLYVNIYKEISEKEKKNAPTSTPVVEKVTTTTFGEKPTKKDNLTGL